MVSSHSFWTLKSQKMLQTGGIRSVHNDTEISTRFIYFVGVPRKTQDSRSSFYSEVCMFCSMFIKKIQSTVEQLSWCSKKTLGIILESIGKCTWKIPSPPPCKHGNRLCTHHALGGNVGSLTYDRALVLLGQPIASLA